MTNHLPPGLLARADQELADLNARLELLLEGCRVVAQENPDVGSIGLVGALRHLILGCTPDPELLALLIAVAVDRLFRIERGQTQGPV